MLHFEQFDGTIEEWDAILKTFPDWEIYQTSAWLRFLAESQNAAPTIAALKDGDDTVGYFAGLIVKKFGLKILGSPFVGWTTERMGLRLLPRVPRGPALKALADYAFRDLGCIHLEFSDCCTTREDAAESRFMELVARNHFVDLAPDEEKIYYNMNRSARRYCNRGGASRGVTIEEAHDEGFAEEHYRQLQDVFGKQGLVPTYGVSRVRLLIRHLQPTGNLLLLRARDSEGHCVATGMFFGMNRHAYFWGNASWRSSQSLRPNEALHWYTMMYFKARGALVYEMGGASYTEKYGAKLSEQLRFRKSKYPWIASARNLAASAFWLYQRVAGAGKRNHHGSEAEKGEQLPVS
jgi:hypothetical protein